MRCAVCHNPEPHRVRENQLIEDIGGPPFWSDTREFDPETDWPVLSEEVGRFSAESAWYPQGDDSAANELIFSISKGIAGWVGTETGAGLIGKILGRKILVGAGGAAVSGGVSAASDLFTYEYKLRVKVAVVMDVKGTIVWDPIFQRVIARDTIYVGNPRITILTLQRRDRVLCNGKLWLDGGWASVGMGEEY